jgi:hypothetical protein
MLLRKSGRAGNQTRTSGLAARKSDIRPQRRSTGAPIATNSIDEMISAVHSNVTPFNLVNHYQHSSETLVMIWHTTRNVCHSSKVRHGFQDGSSHVGSVVDRAVAWKCPLEYFSFPLNHSFDSCSIQGCYNRPIYWLSKSIFGSTPTPHPQNIGHVVSCHKTVSFMVTVTRSLHLV